MSRKHKERPEPESLGLPSGGVDTHAHLDAENYEMGLTTVLERARASGLSRIGNVFLGPDAYLEHRALFADRLEVFFLLAEHPNDTAGFDDARAQRLLDCLRSDPRIRAVGETGLDFYWKDVTPEEQERAFRRHLELARQTDLPPVIHCREAEARTLAVLDDMGFRDRPLLWHCFGGDDALAREILSRGWHVSVPGTVTYARNEPLRAVSAMRNSTLQGGYFILAARALGLDTGPMSGFDNAAVDAAFFADTPRVKSNFISTLGYGDPATIFERSPRPDFGTFNTIA